MNKNNSATLRLLEDPDFFQAAVNFTAQRTAFAARLIERDAEILEKTDGPQATSMRARARIMLLCGPRS